MGEMCVNLWVNEMVGKREKVVGAFMGELMGEIMGEFMGTRWLDG